MRQGRGVLGIGLWTSVVSVAVLSDQAAAQESPVPDSRLGVRTAPLLLLSRVDVQVDLQLNQEQVDAARHQIRALSAKAAELRGKTGADTVTARRQIDDEQERWLAENLSPEQKARLHQIDLQWEGPSALLSRPSVAQALNLSNPQRQALAESIAQRDSERAQGKSRPEDEAELARKALSILTPEQKSKWRGMLGRPFAVAAASAATASPR